MASSLKLAIEIVTPFRQNCAILWDDADKHAVVIDPGGEVDRLIESIDTLGLTVDRILLTHGHIDHAGGAARLRDELAKRAGRPPPIEGPHIADRFLLDGLEITGKGYDIRDARKVTPDRWLNEGDWVEIANLRFEVRHCPGHSPGSVVFICEEIGFAVLGDVLFRGSIGRTDFPYGDTDKLLESIETKVMTLSDATVFLCGHGARSTIGEERRNNPYIAG
jgi:hydroxyacylglutathione hydrolase